MPTATEFPIFLKTTAANGWTAEYVAVMADMHLMTWVPLCKEWWVQPWLSDVDPTDRRYLLSQHRAYADHHTRSLFIQRAIRAVRKYMSLWRGCNVHVVSVEESPPLTRENTQHLQQTNVLTFHPVLPAPTLHAQ